jgi:RNA polymerase subunit RPABC4/transcription elongation factor Spt4
MFEEGYSGYLQGRARLLKILNNRGIIGGGVIFHGFRFANAKESRIKGVPFGWYWSPHWHVVGFLADGYSLCRNCVRNCETDREYCKSCSKGYEGRTRRAYDSDFWIVKIAFFYQLNHSTIIPSRKRFHSLTWFGVCGIRALKLDKSKFKENAALCPVCGSKCVPLTYLGFDRARIAKEFWIKEYE